MLGEHAILHPHNIYNDPIGGQSHPGEATVEQDIVIIGNSDRVLVAQRCGCALDQPKETVASRWNVRAMLNIIARPEGLRGSIVLFVEQSIERFQHDGFIAFLSSLR